MAEVSTAEGWFTAKQAAGYLGVSEPTIFRWMREGRLSYFKLGGATRFRRENLDLVARKVTGREEGSQRAERCAVCGHGFLLPGHLRGFVYFQPDRTKFLVLDDSMVGLEAHACPVCGHVQVFTDADKLRRLMREDDAEGSARAGQERHDE